ncbi:haloacid dehalogenase [Parendozoicomonas sp. Alg238-R29]|uniref:lipin/Ned1/Smp2 family protein n=1 Tax=Parendozoicomonas sp. Alg238-R29 TaxID=2993446 RepID=UPI00248E244B|nr:haloacid dehalogenase [Parendozoicomonas sp. Alg238-R29]
MEWALRDIPDLDFPDYDNKNGNLIMIFSDIFVQAKTGLKLSGLALAMASAQSWAIDAPNPDPNPSPDVPATVGTCPDYSGVLNLPAFHGPEQKRFQRWQSRYWSGNHSPYHMVHDEIANPGESVTVVGKFDYSRTVHKDLEREYVHAYLYGTGLDDWQYLGKYRTDRDGKVSVPVAGKPAGEYIVRMVVEGDLSQADGFVSVVPQGQETVLFDIDGTLTLSDFEQVGDYLGASTAQSWGYAKETVQAYVDKGYRVIYVTGRPYWIARDTREWFTKIIDLPQWHIRTNDDGGSPLSYETEAYKLAYLTSLQQDKGLNIVRAYGNADTDITAFADSGIAKKETWIIGEHAGAQGTQGIYGDYSGHYFDVVESTPNAACRTE